VARTRAVFDASVFVRAAFDETIEATAWLDRFGEGRVDVSAPDLVYAEVANALLQAVRNGKVEVEATLGPLRRLVELPIDVRPNRSLCGLALVLAAETGLTAYDAHYLALAEAEDAVLVTADRALAAAATRSVLLE
jgi:predicted nucleic acid-binding protein